MLSYSLYFRDEREIVGREDFEASDDDDALAMAELLYEACSDHCESFELWQGKRHVNSSLSASLALRQRKSVFEITAHIQERLRQREEAIRDSRWRIAESRRLLERIHQLEVQGLAPGAGPPADPERARRWRMKAEELRTVAEQMKNPTAKGSYLRLAETYETLANNESQRASRTKNTGESSG